MNGVHAAPCPPGFLPYFFIPSLLPLFLLPSFLPSCFLLACLLPSFLPSFVPRCRRRVCAVVMRDNMTQGCPTHAGRSHRFHNSNLISHIVSGLLLFVLRARGELFYEHKKKGARAENCGELRSFSNSPDRENINAQDAKNCEFLKDSGENMVFTKT